MSSSEGITYKEAYATLKNVAEFLPTLQEPDVDVILPKVAEGMAAYKVCMDRIQKALVDLNSMMDADKQEQTE